MSSRLRILALEPYYGGSHRAVLDGLLERCDAEWTLLKLPARKWKWRMRGAAITMAREASSLVSAGARFDLVFASTFLNLAEWRGLAGPALGSVPAIVYFHENQLLYPNRHTAEWDLQFPLTNITSALSAELCVFNTRYNLEGFLREIPGFIRAFPDHRPVGIADEIARKSVVLPPPFDPDPIDASPPSRGGLCRIVWPHRWEHDKDPEGFLTACAALVNEGLDFEVAIAGQAFRESVDLERRARALLSERLVHCAEPADRNEYAALLASSDVAVSTARNEFFGIAMIESCRAGCMPLVPDRLAYQELYPERFRYRDGADLVAKMRAAIVSRPEPGSARDIAGHYTFERLVPDYERLFAQVAGA